MNKKHRFIQQRNEHIRGEYRDMLRAGYRPMQAYSELADQHGLSEDYVRHIVGKLEVRS